MTKKKNIHISVVSPVYSCCSCLLELYRRLKTTLESITKDFEIILVNDASPDNAWNVICDLCKQDNRVHGINFSRNFGQHHAITAGLDHACGEWIVVLDCDLQDQPEEILKLYAKAHEGYDIVLARRFLRQDHFLKRLFSKFFYRTLAYLTGSNQDEKVANFGIYSRKVIDEINRLRESIRYFPTMINWIGFRTARVDVQHASRISGKTGYNFSKMLHLAIDIMLAYSDKPLRLVLKIGLVIASFSFLLGIYIIVKWLAGEIRVLGYASLVTSIWFLSGCILITLGVVGLYVGKIFEGVKERPIYIIREKTWE